MSGYLGQTPGIGQSQYFTFNCTAGQTSFTGTDVYGYTLNYGVGFVDVFLNGRRLTPISDFTAVDGSTITLLAATNASDVLFVTALSAFSLTNWITNAVTYVYVATAGQSSFSGSDINGQTLAYVAGALQVSVNGIVLPPNDYGALDGSTVILGSAVNAGDIVQVFSLRTINPINISSWITNNLTNIADYTYIATQGQTNFGGVAYAGGTLAYKPNCIEVIVNGLVLTPADYVATSGTTVVLNVGCNFDDTVVIRVFGNTTVAGVYTQAQSDAKYVQLGVSNTVTPSMLTQPLTTMTAQATTSGTFVDFLNIPSWARRITILFNGVSTNGTSNPLIQIGSGSLTTSGYLSYGGYSGASSGGANWTTGFGISAGNSINLLYGKSTIELLGSNVYIGTNSLGQNSGGTYYFNFSSGSVTLSGALDRVRITTVNGTDAFDAGSVNVMYE